MLSSLGGAKLNGKLRFVKAWGRIPKMLKMRANVHISGKELDIWGVENV